MKFDESFFHPFQVIYRSKFHKYMIFALLLFTATSILDKALLRDYKLSPNAFIAFQHVYFVFIFFIIFLFKNKRIEFDRRAFKINWKWVVLVSIFTFGYRYTHILAVAIAPVALVLSVKRTSVFFGAILGGKIFREKNLVKKAIATIIMIAGAILLVKEFTI